MDLQASLPVLLKEMHHHGVDVNNERVLEQLQEHATDIPTLRQWTSTSTNISNNNSNSTSTNSWLLLKVLLRIEALQSTLLTSLMQILVHLASTSNNTFNNNQLLVEVLLLLLLLILVLVLVH